MGGKKRKQTEAAPSEKPIEGIAPHQAKALRVLDVLLVLAAIVGAWAFSIWIRMEWIEIAEDRPNTQWEEHYLPTTHDSYLFATIIQQSAQTNALEEPLLNLPDRHQFGALTLLGTALAKQGQPVLDIVTYLPIYLAGLVTIPVVFIGRLYGSTLAGFAAACLATAGSSFFNRTMAGYLDTDIFSVTIPVFILYFLLRAHRESSVPWVVAGSVSVMCYPFFYSSGVPIVTAMALTFMGLRGFTELKAWWKSKDREKDASASGEPSISFSLLSISLLASAVWFCPNSIGSELARNTAPFILGLLILGGLTAGYYWLQSRPLQQQIRFLGGTTAVALIAMCLGSQSIQSIWQNAFRYLPSVKQAKEEKVQGPQPVAYKNVMETVVEAGSREQKAEMRRVVMQRISGSKTASLIALAGYILLVLVFPEFIVALPLLGIGAFAYWGGYRFTVHAVPTAAIAVALLPLGLMEICRRWRVSHQPELEKSTPFQIGTAWPRNWLIGHWVSRALILALTVPVLLPNLKLNSAQSAGLMPVLDRAKVELLDRIKQESLPGDYVHTWWDWGSATWFHAERNVLTTPLNQSQDTFVFAKMMMTDSPRLAAHLGRTSAEYFHHGGPDGSRGVAVQHFFKNRTGTPEEALAELEKSLPVLPTRGVYLYLPTDLLRFYHVLHMFGERDLVTGQESQPDNWFYFQTMRYAGSNHELVWLENCPYAPGFRMLAEPRQGVLCDVEKRVTLQQLLTLRRSGKSLQSLGWSHDAVSLQIKNGPLVHGTKINLNDEKVQLELLNGQAAETQMDRVEWVCPTYLMKSAERSDTQQTFFESTDSNNSGLRLILSHTPPFAMVVDEPAYRTQLIQLLGLGQGDPEYFEPIGTNQGGRVYKLKK